MPSLREMVRGKEVEDKIKRILQMWRLFSVCLFEPLPNFWSAVHIRVLSIFAISKISVRRERISDA